MNIKFDTLTIHHFLSFGEAVIDLKDKGFCLVKGINRNPKDAAKSNGSGKSTIWNAVAYVLTGETCQGLKSDLGNLYYNDGCWVELTFTADDKKFKLTRYKDDSKYGTDLKVIVDGVDKSGKGIRESQVVLDQLLPDITSELVGSVIILGQGLPQKFTNNSPAGRKEILEHLSKSDFMIEDIKARIDKRSNELQVKERNYEDTILKLSSQKDIINSQIVSTQKELDAALVVVDYDSLIINKTTELNQVTESINTTQKEIDSLTLDLNKYNNIIVEASNKREKSLDTVRSQHDEAAKEFSKRNIDLSNKASVLNAEISRLKSIKDVCPTCHQHIPNVIKPDTSKQEADLVTIKEQQNKLNEELTNDASDYAAVIKEINDIFTNDSTNAKENYSKLNYDLTNKQLMLKKLQSSQLSLNQELSNLKNSKLNYLNNQKRLQDTLNTLNKQSSGIVEQETTTNKDKTLLEEHISVIAQMNTLVKRDFRGFLLTNVIEFINTKSKEYCAKIFNTDDICFVLDGNAIDIKFCNKEYENLSGGEKQRVDLIVQFAIRDMMCQYLGFSSNILVLDEITDALDAVSCDKVINFITTELSDIESVFIISHHSDELMLPSECEIVVEKNENGVSKIK
jgi:DNA repair exonuclease SbcCD ATPase subunit